MNETVELGKEYMDVVSGFKGIAIASTTWLYGCVRISLQPKMGKDGKVPANETFDAGQLKQVGLGVKVKVKDTGGDERFSPKQW